MFNFESILNDLILKQKIIFNYQLSINFQFFNYLIFNWIPASAGMTVEVREWQGFSKLNHSVIQNWFKIQNSKFEIQNYWWDCHGLRPRN